MVTNNHYRWDFIGLSTDEKPTPATSDKVVDGSTYYCSDTSKLYVYCKDNWYERKSLGGGDITVVQTTGTSTTDVMSQKAVTDALANAGSIKELTTADYNYPVSNPTSVSVALLPAGLYRPANNDVYIYDGQTSKKNRQDLYFLVSKADSNGWIYVWVFNPEGRLTSNSYKITCFQANPTTGAFNTLTDSGRILQADYITQSTGQSQGLVMSQDATTKLIYPDIVNNPYRMLIGEGSANATGVAINGVLNSDGKGIAIGYPGGSNASIGGNGRAYNGIAIGTQAGVGKGDDSIAIGYNAYTKSSASVNAGNNVSIGRSAVIMEHENSVALGGNATVSRNGEVNIGTGTNGTGYNSTNYRVLGGVHDGQLAQDAVTVNQVNSVIDAINAALSTNISHIGA